MKKLLSTLLLATSVVIAAAQSFQVLDKTTGLPITSKTVFANPTKTTHTEFYIKNLTNSTKEFTIKMKVTSSPSPSILESVFLQFCDQVSCYPINSSTGEVEGFTNEIKGNEVLGLTPGEYEFGFLTDLFPKSSTDITGTYVVTFDLTNVADTNDKTTITVTYRAYVGVEENIALSYKIGDAYPSPASENVFIDYNFASQPKTATLELYNVVGIKVNELNIEGTEGKIKMDVSNLSNGVYFYSLLVDGEKVNTKNFTIIH